MGGKPCAVVPGVVWRYLGKWDVSDSGGKRGIRHVRLGEILAANLRVREPRISNKRAHRVALNANHVGALRGPGDEPTCAYTWL